MVKPWQYTFIERLCTEDLSIKEQLAIKLESGVIPHSLLKFHSPTEYAFENLENQRIWLSNPNLFNDPFDCKIAFNKDEYLKYITIKSILRDIYHSSSNDNKNQFTREDLRAVYETKDTSNLKRRSLPRYSKSITVVLRQLLEDKSEDFRKQIKNDLWKRFETIDEYIKFNQILDTRVACFCSYGYDEDQEKVNLMWSHYADSHKGFCVEYDIDLIKRNINQADADNTLDGNILVNLLPIYYTKHRVCIPKTILNKIAEGRMATKDEESLRKTFLKSYLTKSTIWKYENEWRLILTDKFYNVNNTIHFPYASSIHIGSNATQPTIDRLKLIGEKLKVPVNRVSVNENTYSMNNFYPFNSIYDKEF